MRGTLTAAATAVALLGWSLSGTTWAQEPVQSFDQLQRVLKVGQTVVVTDTDGRKTKGKVQDVTTSLLVVQASDTRRFPEPAVLKVRRTDSLWNGTLIGLGVGAAIGVFGYAAARESDAAYFWAYVGIWLFPAAGAGIGAIVDSTTGNEIVYVAPTRVGAGRVTLSPLLARRATGLSVCLRF